MKKSFAELYLDNSLFADDANKTIGQPIIGEQFETLVANRRKVTNRLTDDGQMVLKKIVDELSKATGKKITAKWDIHCGCSMCPCSPGFRLITNVEMWGKSNNKNRFNIWTDEQGNIDRIDAPQYNDIRDVPFYEAVKSADMFVNPIK